VDPSWPRPAWKLAVMDAKVQGLLKSDRKFKIYKYLGYKMACNKIFTGIPDFLLDNRDFQEYAVISR
jgi:hypothetical protein